MKTKLIQLLLVFGLAACTAAPRPHPTFVYPVDRQTLDLELIYLFRVTPVEGADGYRWDFYQNGVLVWENLRDEGTLSPSDYGIAPGSTGHSRFVSGDVRVEVRARINGKWSDPAVITIYLRPLPTMPSPTALNFVTDTPTLVFTQTPSPLFGPKASLTAFAEANPSSTPTPLTTLVPGVRVILTMIDMRGISQGWGIDSHGKIVHTRDGGKTWKDVTPSPEEYGPGGFFALDALRAWATPNQPGFFSANPPTSPLSMTVWYTDDGGVSWQPSSTVCLSGDCGYNYDVPPEYVRPISLQFLDDRTGWMLIADEHHMFQDRYRIFRTTDGGQTWKFVIDNTNAPWAYFVTGLAFQDEQAGWLAIDQVEGATLPSADWGIYRTDDGGNNWKYLSLPAPAGLPEVFSQGTPWCGTLRLHFLPPSSLDTTVTCEVFGYQTSPWPTFYYHFHSPDGGKTWQSWPETGAVDFLSALLGWRISDPGSGQPKQLQQSSDGGRTWTTIARVAWPQAQLDFTDGQNGWAIVASGEATSLVRTTDGGRTWIVIKPQVAP
ncbi:MAG TPA: hypothetical protein VMC09_14955 [Anaerolineales bacterium]|nr:hypothetical protein [Anaerolineales bacterium]